MVLKKYFLKLPPNVVGGDVVMLVVFIPFWFRLVNKVGVITGQGQKKNTEVKLI